MKRDSRLRPARGFFALRLTVLIAMILSLLPIPAYAAKDRKAPSAPTGLRVVQKTDVSATLAWTPSTDNVGVASYLVYKNAALAGTSSTPGFAVTSLSPSTTYTFTVKAKDAAGNVSSASTPISVTTSAPTAPAPTPAPGAAPKLIGYYGGWSTYTGSQIADVDGSKLTHLFYAFANIGDDWKVQVGDPYADTEKTFPGDTGSEPFCGNFNQLLKLKQRYPHLKTYISVGGWSWSAKFSDAAASDAARTAFADSAVAFAAKYGFDGVDIDWEYPVSGGMAGNTHRPEDKTNFTLLMQKLREKLDAQSTRDGKTYGLSFAGAAGAYYAANTELGKLQAVCDIVGIMTYDIHGTWDGITGLNAPLYRDPNSGFASDWSVHDAVRLYVGQGVPASKIVLGVPFYGYKYDNVAGTARGGLYQPFSGGKSVSYATIAASYAPAGSGYARSFHADSKVPSLFNGTSFISYDDPESVALKGAYAKAQGLGGAMIWDLGQDTAGHDLLNALYASMR
ncbi:glycosyl hydrolase family 18 protein [Paenibacillus flagellatus]|uniref:glycosyl hydrolase family 18 protein n=1 Tax=Paenibacillus flagellatus TaxID=2211139 RepID=UPI001FE2E72B|nr:glycosyl hydrolase family 18 protein [Paenibacillus flagellatus]